MAHKGSGRNADGMGTIRKKTVIRNGREYTYWEGRCTVGYDPGTGKQIQKSFTAKTQKEVTQKIKELTREIDSGSYVEPCKLTVAEFLEIWQKEYLNSVKPNTAHGYRTHCRVHIIPGIGAVKLCKLTPLIIQRFYNSLENATTSKPLSPKSVRNIHGVLHKALECAVNLKYIASNPAEATGIDLPREDPHEILPMEDEEVKRFIEVVQNHRYRILYLITLFTGLREGEILGLSWDCIDWDNHILTIRQQLQKNREKKAYCIETPKNSKSRRIVVADAVIGLLQEQLELQSQLKSNAGRSWRNKWNLVFTKEDGSNLAINTVYHNYKRLVKEIDCESRRFHDLRHCFASTSLENGDDAKTVQENLGHHSAAFTLKQYGHVKKTMAIASAQRMEAYIQNVMPENANNR